MKLLMLTCLFVFAYCFLFGQTEQIDRLISKIDNNQLFGTCNYAWVLKNASKEADTLINLARQTDANLKSPFRKEILRELLSLTDDSTRGIIVHYILTNIYTSFIQQKAEFLNDSSLTIRYAYNNLIFYWDKEKEMHASSAILSENKRSWKQKIR